MSNRDAGTEPFSSLSARVLRIVALTTLSLFALLYIPLRSILLKSVLELEEQKLNRNIRQAINELVDTGENLATLTSDYALWDDTYDFMETRDPAYINSSYVAGTYSDCGLNVILLISPDGEIVYGKAFDLASETFTAIPEPLLALLPDSPMLQRETIEDALVGIMMFPDLPMFISIYPILNSNNEGPARGTLITSRFIDEVEIARLTETTELSITLTPIDAPGMETVRDTLFESDSGLLISPLDRETIAGYATIPDINDDPALILQITEARDIYAQGQTALSYMGGAILVAAIAFGIVIRALLQWTVLSRLQQLGDRVSQIGDLGARGDFSKRVDIGGHDELELLADHINHMLDNLEHYQRALLLQKQRFEDLVAVARATVERPALTSTLQNALEVARQLTRAERGSLFLLSEVGTVTYSILARKHATPAEQKNLVGQVMHSGLAGWVAQHRQPVLLPDTTQDKRWLTLPDEPYVARSALAVPILSGTRKVGILTLTHPDVAHFNEEDTQLMQGAADQMALAIRNAQIYDDQRQLAERQTTLYEVLNTISTHLDPESVLNVAVQTVAQRIGWPQITIFLYDEASGDLVSRASAKDPTAVMSIPSSKGIVGRAYRENQTQHVTNVHADQDYVNTLAATCCELAVPLRRGEQRLGVLNIEHDHEMAFRAEDIVLAESLADAIVLAITNAQLFQAIAGERSRLEALIESSQDGILLVGTNMTIMVINAAAIKMLALPGTPEDWLNRRLWDFLSELRHHAPDAARSLVRELRRIKKGTEPPAEDETMVAQRTLHWINLPVIQANTSTGRLIVLHDMTEERLLEHMRDELTHMMVHDLRNPLTGIYGSLKLLLGKAKSKLSDDHVKMLEIADNNTQRMLRLVNAILDISRLQSGQMPLERMDIRLETLVADVVRLQHPQASDKNIQIQIEFPDESAPVWGDATLIERVLQNLIGNAIKFTPEDGSIRVTAYPSEDDPGKIKISISDTGYGISPEIRDHLFEKFATGKHKGRGTGLGLTFCKMALEAHGEDIWVDSTSTHGTTFAFTLPMHKSVP